MEKFHESKIQAQVVQGQPQETYYALDATIDHHAQELSYFRSPPRSLYESRGQKNSAGHVHTWTISVWNIAGLQ